MSLIHYSAIVLFVAVARIQGKECEENEFQCLDGTECIPRVNFCEGRSDCSDGSDEPQYPAQGDNNVTLCRGRVMYYGALCHLPQYLEPDRDKLCRNNGLHCIEEEFECLDLSRCAAPWDFCDGYIDCKDGSDEPEYATYEYNNSRLCRGTSTIQAAICVLPWYLESDRKKLCRSDIHCSEEEFECRDSSKMCLRLSSFCDGDMDCSDGSDEPYATYDDNNGTLCRRTKEKPRLCRLPPELEQKRDYLCSDKIHCSEEEFECGDPSKMCLPLSSFCDGKTDCSDGSDEPYATYDDNGTLCRMVTDEARLCNLPPELHHKRHSLCRDHLNCSSEDFECVDGSRCISHFEFCSKWPACRYNYTIDHMSDGSDQWMSPPAVDSGYRMCLGVLSEKHGWSKPCQLREDYFCDGEKQICAEGMDECLCGGKDKDHFDDICFRCLTTRQSYIPISKLCDRKFDCPDLTDECLCQSSERPKICDRIIWDGRDPYLQCQESNISKRININNAQVCDVNSDCNFVENEVHCGKVGHTGAVCSDAIDPRIGSAYCLYLTATRSFDSCFGENLHCKVFLDNYEFVERISESSHQWVTCSLSRYKGRLCAPVFNCTADGSYQDVLANKFCESQGGIACGCSYFYCDHDVDAKYIHSKAVCNGYKDCLSGLDECQPGCIQSAFSDEKSLITNKALLTLVWILSIFSIIGCISVVASTLHDIVKTDSRDANSRHSSINKLLILNLSVSDLLVGVYTISICIKAIEVEGKYCTVDIEWRTSTACSILGAVLIIGSEQSVLTMVLITIYRLHAVMRPISRPEMNRAILAIAISWMASLLFGLMPMIPNFEDYFLKYVSFNDTSIFKTKVNQTEKSRIINWLSLMDNGTLNHYVDRSTEWRQLRDLISQINPSSPITATQEFGYYSTHTVCLPALFPNRKDKSWMYSFSLLWVNFMAFVFMLVCYVALYRKAKDMTVLESTTARSQRNKQSVAMQRKLTRILASDFLCWVPVCIMGFLQVAGVDISDDAYLPTGLLILPINSALNPFLYSDLPDVLLAQKSKVVSWTEKSFRRISGSEQNTRASRVEAIEM